REQPVGVDPLAVELVPIDANPRRHDLRRNLGVELGAEAAADHERLRPGGAVSDKPRTGGHREAIEVPPEPWALGHERGVVRSHRQPADLGFMGPKRLAAELAGEELAAEAYAEHRHVGLQRRPQEATLPPDPGARLVAGGELRPEG